MITVEDGYRESAESWEAVLRDLKRRACVPRSSPWATVLSASGPLYATYGRRPANSATGSTNSATSSTLPKRLQPRGKAALHEVMYAETRGQAREAITRFATEFGPKYPKALTTLEKDADTLLTFFDFPAEHWKHLRTSNVIESPFATMRLRQRVTKGARSRTKGLLMAYKLLDMAQARWRRLDGAHLLPLVRAGIMFVDGAQHATTGRRSSARAA